MIDTIEASGLQVPHVELSSGRKAAVAFSYYLGLLVEVVAGICLVAAACLVVSQVVFRYLLQSPLDWTEEAARFTAIWAGLLGAALGVRSNAHFRVLLLFNRFSAARQRFLEALCRVLATAMLIVIVWTSFQYALDLGLDQLSPGLRISMAWLYAVIPVATTLMLIFMFCEAVGGSVRPLWTEERTSEADLIERIVEEAARAGALVEADKAGREERTP